MKQNDVKDDAKKIWHLLAVREKISVNEICRQIGKTNDVVLLALGWLMKENKIELSDDDKIVVTNFSITEIYY